MSWTEPKSTDEDTRRREYILNVIFVGSIIMLVALDALVLVYALRDGGGTTAAISFEVFSIFPVCFILLYMLSRRGWFVVSSYLLIGAYFLGNTYAAYRWGVNSPASLVGYALLILIASILISTRFAFFVAGAVALVVLPLWSAQLHGLMATDAIQFTDGDGITLVILYGFITLVAWLSNREIERSLMCARRSELALKEERDSLEIKVEERTRELQSAQLEKIDHLYRFAEFGQIASGLFHDLTSILTALSLRAEKNPDAAASSSLANAFEVQNEIGRFTEAVRRQLNREEILEEFSLSAAILRAVKLLEHKCHAEHVRISFEPSISSSATTFGDPAKFHQVVVNLLMNAIEAGGNAIRISLAREGDDAVIQVIDNGPGIAPDIKTKIFEPFFTTKHAEKKGIGIGLAITKRIIEKDFGGAIDVESEIGKGTAFTVRFPLRAEVH